MSYIYGEFSPKQRWKDAGLVEKCFPSERVLNHFLIFYVSNCIK